MSCNWPWTFEQEVVVSGGVSGLLGALFLFSPTAKPLVFLNGSFLVAVVLVLSPCAQFTKLGPLLVLRSSLGIRGNGTFACPSGEVSIIIGMSLWRHLCPSFSRLPQKEDVLLPSSDFA